MILFSTQLILWNQGIAARLIGICGVALLIVLMYIGIDIARGSMRLEDRPKDKEEDRPKVESDRESSRDKLMRLMEYNDKRFNEKRVCYICGNKLNVYFMPKIYSCGHPVYVCVRCGEESECPHCKKRSGSLNNHGIQS